MVQTRLRGCMRTWQAVALATFPRSAALLVAVVRSGEAAAELGFPKAGLYVRIV